MEQKFGLSPSELEESFEKISAGNSAEGDRLYKVYKAPLMSLAKTYGLALEDAQDLYNDVFSYVYDKVIENVIEAKEFNKYIIVLMKEQSIKYNESKHKQEEYYFSSEQSTESSVYDDVIENEFYRASKMFVFNFLQKLKDNPELAEQYNLDKQAVGMVMDHYGLNKEKKTYSIEELAEKYNVNTHRVIAHMAKAMPKIREIEEFQPIKNQL